MSPSEGLRHWSVPVPAPEPQPQSSPATTGGVSALSHLMPCYFPLDFHSSKAPSKLPSMREYDRLVSRFIDHFESVCCTSNLPPHVSGPAQRQAEWYHTSAPCRDSACLSRFQYLLPLLCSVYLYVYPLDHSQGLSKLGSDAAHQCGASFCGSSQLLALHPVHPRSRR